MANPENTYLDKYYEMIAPEQPANGQFSPDGSQATLDFIMDYKQMTQFAKDMLGECTINPLGYLNRKLPMSHPTFTYMSASGITTVQGLGIDGRTNVTLFTNKDKMGTVNYNATQYQANYNQYKLTVNFTTRPYLQLSDRQIQNFQNWGTDFNYAVKSKDGVAVATYKEYFEMLRFTSVNTTPAVEVLVNNRGQYYFRSNGAPADQNAPADGKPISTQNSGSVYVVQPRNIVCVKWFFVPYQMVESLGISQGVNKVNFGYDYGNTISTGNFHDYGYKFLGYPSGALLFRNFKVTPYSAAIPPSIFSAASPESALVSWFANTYCDIEMEFIEVEIPDDQVGVLPDRTTLANQYGKIFYGHNMVPFSRNKKYYYVESQEDVAKGFPIYWSYAMSRLFQYIAP
jgi:hypothetical protein